MQIKIPSDFAVQPLKAGETATDRVTCGTCGLSWDDAIATSYTPAPSARCPFEAFHAGDTIERFTVPLVSHVLQIEGTSEETAAQIVAIFERHKIERGFTHEDALNEIDTLLGNHGIETISAGDDDTYTDEGIRMCPPFSYSNNGDSYAWTVVRDHEARQWLICGWADALEEYERSHETGDYETFEECPEVCPSCHGKALTLKHFPGSARGPSYSWVCDSCNHHCLAVDGYEPDAKEDADA